MGIGIGRGREKFLTLFLFGLLASNLFLGILNLCLIFAKSIKTFLF